MFYCTISSLLFWQTSHSISFIRIEPFPVLIPRKMVSKHLFAVAMIMNSELQVWSVKFLVSQFSNVFSV